MGGYFKDPSGNSRLVGSNANGTSVFVAMKKEDLHNLKEKLQNSIHRIDPMDKLKHQIEITITDEGLRIELMESEKGTFFSVGQRAANAGTEGSFAGAVAGIGFAPHKVSIEGHTDSKPYSQTNSYDNWDLSSDRANEARRMMQKEGVRKDQFSQVRGFADQRLRLADHPEDPSNRRVSLIVQYQIQNNAEVPLAKDIKHSPGVASAK